MKKKILAIIALIGLLISVDATNRECHKIYIGDFDCDKKADFIKQKTSQIKNDFLPDAELFKNISCLYNNKS